MISIPIIGGKTRSHINRRGGNRECLTPNNGTIQFTEACPTPTLYQIVTLQIFKNEAISLT